MGAAGLDVPAEEQAGIKRNAATHQGDNAADSTDRCHPQHQGNQKNPEAADTAADFTSGQRRARPHEVLLTVSALSAVGGNATICDTDDAVALCRQFFIMGDQLKCSVMAARCLDQQLHDLVAGGLIQISRRFVSKQYLRAGDYGRAIATALLLTPGKLVGKMVKPVTKSDIDQRRLGLGKSLSITIQFKRDGGVFKRGH